MRLQQLVSEQNATEQLRRQRAKEMLAAGFAMHLAGYGKNWADLR